MNLKITLQTLRRIEQLLDGWQSSGDIPAIERDLACDLLRRAYDDIFFSDKSAATAPEAPLAENTPADHANEEAAGEAADTPADAAVAADDAPVADVALPVGLAGLASSVEAAEGTPGESPENTESVEDPAAEPAPIEVPAEAPAEEDAPVETPTKEDAPVETPAQESASVEESVSVEKSVDEPASAETPVEEHTPVEAPVGEIAEEEFPVEEFGETGEVGDAVGKAGDTVSPAEDVATSIPELSANIVIDPVIEVFTDEDEDAEELSAAEEPEDSEAVETVDLAAAVNVAESVEAARAAEDTETAEEIEIVEELEAEETEIEQPDAAPSAMQHAAKQSVAATVQPAAKSEAESVLAAAPAGTSAEETPADAAASNAETLEEMAARFKNASGRRRKSRRAFMSLYDDDETLRSGAQSDQLELSDWGVDPSDTSAKLRHTRELFGLPADDPDTTIEPTPQSEAEADDEMEVIDFVGDDDLVQSDRPTKPTPAPTAAPTAPTPRPAAAPAREERDDAEEDLTLDSIEIVEIADGDDVTPEIEEDETQHVDLTEVADEPVKSEPVAPAASATEPAAAHTLYGHEDEPELPASTMVLGEVMGHDVPTVADTLGHDAPTVGDTLGHRPDVAGWTEVDDDLNHAISVGDRFVLLRDLFDGDQALCDRTLKRLSTFDDLDDCMIWITENFAWNANSEGAKLIMGLLERKLG